MPNWNDALLRTLGGSLNQFTKATVLVSNTATELFSLNATPGLYRIYLKNIGSVALNSCKIQGRNSVEGTWQDVVDTSTEFTTIPSQISGFLISSDDTISPTALSTGQEWNGSIDTHSYRYVRMISTVAAGSTNIKVEVS